MVAFEISLEQVQKPNIKCFLHMISLGNKKETVAQYSDVL